MGSGAIYAVIVALWAVVLIPMWLRRHDEANETRSVDRYRGAMRSLSRRTAASSREVLMPARDRGAVDVTVTGAGTRATATVDPTRRATSRPAERVPASVREARSRAAARRRRVLAVLGVVLVLVVGLVLLGRLSRWSVVLPVALLGAFVVAARRSLRLQVDLDRRLARGAVLREHAERVQHEVGRRRRDAVRPGGRVVEAEAVPAFLDDDAWDPVSAPLPTYVTAPAASRIPRVIDLTTPGHWNGAAMVEEVRRSRQPAAEPLFDQTAEELPPRVATGGSFADRFVDDEPAVGLVDDREFFDQYDDVDHRRAVND